jgi:D,D-heptose 1,7-bisphosphate phosphatase
MNKSPFITEIDASWTLFLDRDGVINMNLDKGFVETLEDFEFISGVLEAFYRMSEKFYKILVVTNQQSINRGLISHEDVQRIHEYMVYEVENARGKIDQVYYCPAMPHEQSFYQKPQPGMALEAQKDFPFIDFAKSIMIGDSISDMHFGRNLGMKTVYVGQQKLAFSDRLVDMYVPSLLHFSLLLQREDD